MLTVATLFWQPNEGSKTFSRCYDETWVEKLYRGFARNLTLPFRFVCYVDQGYVFDEPVEQVRIKAKVPDYSTCIEPYRMGEPMILVGLDTLVIGNIDHLARSCLIRRDLGLPRDPYKPAQACNGVALVPEGMAHIGTTHRGENDMEWVRGFPHSFLDDEFPGEIVSFKGSVERRGARNAKIIYFHGERKMHQLRSALIEQHWR